MYINLLSRLVGKVKADELEYRITGLVPDRRYVFGVASKARTGESTIVESQPTVLKKDPGESSFNGACPKSSRKYNNVLDVCK